MASAEENGNYYVGFRVSGGRGRGYGGFGGRVDLRLGMNHTHANILQTSYVSRLPHEGLGFTEAWSRNPLKVGMTIHCALSPKPKP